MAEEKRVEIYQKLLEHKVPCIIFSNELQPDESFIEIAQKNDIPVFGTCKKTSSFMGELIRWLNVKLAPCISIHGVLVDVYGVGVLIMGESGIGKSEAALELIKRGHRLVTDDVVEIRKEELFLQFDSVTSELLYLSVKPEALTERITDLGEGGKRE